MKNDTRNNLVQVRDVKNGKVKTMKKVFADALVKSKRMEYYEAPIEKVVVAAEPKDIIQDPAQEEASSTEEAKETKDLTAEKTESKRTYKRKDMQAE